jgi:predicted negative regulator of RcsB-dependent stress response
VDIESLSKLVGSPRDSAMLRLTLARLLAEQQRFEEAVTHLEYAVQREPQYTAAWKELGKACLAREDHGGARRAWESGIEAARKNGDKQAEKEMAVFLRRLDK